MKHISLITIASRLAGIIAGGTVFFRFVEGWSWIDSYFFTVVTISTVGYGHPVPITDLGKVGATILIFAGLGVFAVALQQIAFESLSERERNPGAIQRMLHRLKSAHHHKHEHQKHSDQHKGPGPRDD